jgi:8-oxo-dGTP pyrophosphatase MutT (NUDIX family)
MKMKPEFSNRKNELIEAVDGRAFWVSRSCAVIAEICMFNRDDGHWYILLAKRGGATPDFQGYWGLPCGYLDWDETLCDALIREVWEECDLFLPAIAKNAQFVRSSSSFIMIDVETKDTPWRIYDTPDKGKQNLGFHYAILFGWAGMPFPALSNINVGAGETEDLDWVKVDQAMSMQLAFNHQLAIARLFTEKKSEFAVLEADCLKDRQ